MAGARREGGMRACVRAARLSQHCGAGQVNVLAPYILNAKLLDVVADRIINVSSISLADFLDWDNLQSEKGYEREGHAGSGVQAAAAPSCCLAHTPRPPTPRCCSLRAQQALPQHAGEYLASRKAGPNVLLTHAFPPPSLQTYYLAHRLQKAGRHKPTVLAVDPGTVATKLLLAGWGEVRVQHEAQRWCQCAPAPLPTHTTSTCADPARRCHAGGGGGRRVLGGHRSGAGKGVGPILCE